jgi:hypothetical protein
VVVPDFQITCILRYEGFAVSIQNDDDRQAEARGILIFLIHLAVMFLIDVEAGGDFG